MVELRKRKTPPPAPVRPAKKQAAPKAAPKAAKGKGSKVEQAKAAVAEKVEAVKETIIGKPNGAAEAAPAATASASTSAPSVGDTIDLTAFGGEVETHEGTKTSLAKLVGESKSGVVLFTYPKASTPGCTKQVCFFRDSYAPLTSTGFNLYGLSNDSPKANTTFVTKQNLPYPLLCDPSRTLISAIGLKGAKGTTRGVFVIDKSGKVLAAEPGSPEGTVNVVRKIIGTESGAAPTTAGAPKETDAELAKTASEVADTAAKLDGAKA